MFLCLTYEQRRRGKIWGSRRKKEKAAEPLWQLVHGVLDWTQTLILPAALGRCHFKCSWTKQTMMAQLLQRAGQLLFGWACACEWEKVLAHSCSGNGNPVLSNCMGYGCNPLLGGQTHCSSSLLVPCCFHANKEALALLLLIFSVEFCW